MKRSIIHGTAVVDPGASVGAGCRIWHFTHVASGAVIGEECSLGQNVYVAPSGRLGRGVRVQNNVSIYDGVVCEDFVFLGPCCVFTNVLNPRSQISRKHEYRKRFSAVFRSAGMRWSAPGLLSFRMSWIMNWWLAIRQSISAGSEKAVAGWISMNRERLFVVIRTRVTGF